MKGRFNALAEGRLRRVLERLERVPPLDRALLRIRILKWPAFFVAGLLTADLAMLGLGSYLDTGKPPPPAKPRVIVEAPYVKSLTSYEAIIARNAFCPGCPVPDMKVRAMERPKDCNKAVPLQGNLKLLGTIVLSDPRYSVATVNDGGAESTAILIGDTFREFGKVLEIRRNRVCFLKDDNSLVYIEIPDEDLKLGQPLPKVFASSVAQGISRTSDTDFSVKRTFLLEKLNDPKLLMDAYAIPASQNGQKGFRIVSINPGSIYEALGIQSEDFLFGLDGAPMDSIARAQEAYNSIRTRDTVQIDIIRGGTPMTLRFKIK